MRGEARLVVLVGHPRAGSRTHAVARRVGELLGAALAGPGTGAPAAGLVDLAELAPRLLSHLSPPPTPDLDSDGDGSAEAALRTVGQAPLLLVASPTFRGSYSGLLKLFLDLLPRYGLAGAVVVPLMTAGIPAHRFTVDANLRPVLMELGAQVPTAGISVLESELDCVEAVFAAWWRAQAGNLRACLLPGNGKPAGTEREEVRTC
jgi:FMN reductase